MLVLANGGGGYGGGGMPSTRLLRSGLGVRMGMGWGLGLRLGSGFWDFGCGFTRHFEVASGLVMGFAKTAMSIITGSF